MNGRGPCVFITELSTQSDSPSLSLERGKVMLCLLLNEGSNYKPGVGWDPLLSGGCRTNGILSSLVPHYPPTVQ